MTLLSFFEPKGVIKALQPNFLRSLILSLKGKKPSEAAYRVEAPTIKTASADSAISVSLI